MSIRTVLLLLALGLLSLGCASKKKDPYYMKREGRDYTSVNKTSVSFLFETFRQDRELRREGKKRVWNWGQLRQENAELQKHSIAFLGNALAAGEAENWKITWTEDFPELLKGPEDFGASVRFGFLDTGD